jgi:hypothetical protein
MLFHDINIEECCVLVISVLTSECDEQVGGILECLENELELKPTKDWIPKATFLANLKNPFKIGLLMGPDSPEVSSLAACSVGWCANYVFQCPACLLGMALKSGSMV